MEMFYAGTNVSKRIKFCIAPCVAFASESEALQMEPVKHAFSGHVKVSNTGRFNGSFNTKHLLRK